MNDEAPRRTGSHQPLETDAGHPAFRACWSCHGAVDIRLAFCDTCGAVQPPGNADHFTRLGLKVNFDVDPRILDERYFADQRLLHPDRFTRKTARERALSQSQAVALNEAYETLKDPFRRADYMIHLKQAGEPTEGCNLVNDQDLLTESMELREALAEAETEQEIKALSDRAEADIQACVTDLSATFVNEDIATASRLATRLKYLRKLEEECHQRRARLAKST